MITENPKYYLQESENEVKFRKVKIFALLVSFVVLLFLST